MKRNNSGEPQWGLQFSQGERLRPAHGRWRIGPGIQPRLKSERTVSKSQSERQNWGCVTGRVQGQGNKWKSQHARKAQNRQFWANGAWKCFHFHFNWPLASDPSPVCATRPRIDTWLLDFRCDKISLVGPRGFALDMRRPNHSRHQCTWIGSSFLLIQSRDSP